MVNSIHVNDERLTFVIDWTHSSRWSQPAEWFLIYDSRKLLHILTPPTFSNSRCQTHSRNIIVEFSVNKFLRNFRLSSKWWVSSVIFLCVSSMESVLLWSERVFSCSCSDQNQYCHYSIAIFLGSEKPECHQVNFFDQLLSFFIGWYQHHILVSLWRKRRGIQEATFWN